MKIAAGRADAFVAAPDESARAVLVYGPDTGLVRERTVALIRSVAGDTGDPFRVCELTGAALRADPARLASEAGALSMTGGRRVVCVSDATDALAAGVERLLADGSWEALVIVSAGELAPRSSLRKLFEGSKESAALACYQDDGAALSAVVQSTLGQSNITASREAISYLMGRLGVDRQVTRRELEKLALYVGQDGTVDLEAAELIVGDSAGRSLDDVVFAAGSGDRATLDLALVQAVQEGISPVAVLRAASRHFERLLRAADMLSTGATIDGAMKALRPPVFFKRIDQFGEQVRRWGRPQLVAALDRLMEAELRCKTTGAPTEALCGRALFEVAQVGIRSAR